MNKILKNSLLTLALITNLNANSEKDTIIFGQSADVVTYDTAKSTSAYSAHALSAMYSTLFYYDKKGNLVGDIAKDWQFSKDGKTLIIHLKEGLKFNKTAYWQVDDDLTAEDVVFTIKRQYDEGNKFYKQDSKFSQMRSDGLLEIMEDAIAVDKQTVKFKLKEKSAVFLSLFSGGKTYSAINSKDYAESLYKKGRYKDDYSQYPVGSGSYYYVESKKGQYLKLKKSDTALTQAKTENLIIKVIKNPMVMIAALQAGDVDIIDEIPTESLKALEEDKGVNIYSEQSPKMLSLVFNTQDKITSNKLVRQALAYAINQDDLLHVYKGVAGKANNVYPEFMSGWVKTKEYKQNIKKAKELLKKAGYPNGFTMQMMYANTKAGQKEVVQIIQAQLSEIGVKVKLVTFDWGTYLDKLDYLKYGQATLLTWNGTTLDPNGFLYPLLHSSKQPTMNTAGFKNKKVDKLLEEGRAELDSKKRDKIYKKVNTTIKNMMVMYPIAHPYYIIAASKDLKGEFFTTSSSVNYAKIYK